MTNKQVTRYGFITVPKDGTQHFKELDNGAYVSYSDYEDLEDDNKELRHALDDARSMNYESEYAKVAHELRELKEQYASKS